MEAVDMTYIKQARELQEFFIGTYAEHALEDAIKSGNNELIRLAVREYSSAKQLIEQAEER